MQSNSNKIKEDPYRILLVDDEPDVTLGFEIGLEDNGFAVDAFNDPLQALSNFKSDFYDLALIDYKLPMMNGFELYKELRKTDDKVKVCFITASEIYYHKEIAKELLSGLGVRRLIRKPIRIDDLVKELEQELY